MARNLARVPYIEDVPDDFGRVVEGINDRITEINRIFTEAEAEINQQKGNDGATPIFNSEPDLREHRITNGERSKNPRDFVIRQELMDLGLVGDASGRVVFGGEVEFAGGTVVSGPSGGSGVVSGIDLEAVVDSAIGANVATSRDGDQVVVEEADGTDGSTEGTLGMARDQDGKARHLRMEQGRLTVTAPRLEGLIEVLIEEIRGLRYGD